MLKKFAEALTLLREINRRTYIMSAELTKILELTKGLVGHVQTLISIARKPATDPADQAAVDAIEKSLADTDKAVTDALAALQPKPADPPPETKPADPPPAATQPATPAA